MKFRLTKYQAELLLDGKTLKTGRQLIALPEDFQDRWLLEKFVNDDVYRTKVSLFINLDTKAIEIQNGGSRK